MLLLHAHYAIKLILSHLTTPIWPFEKPVIEVTLHNCQGIFCNPSCRLTCPAS